MHYQSENSADIVNRQINRFGELLEASPATSGPAGLALDTPGATSCLHTTPLREAVREPLIYVEGNEPYSDI